MVAPAPLRIVFFGTPSFAVPTLDALIASRHRVVAVVTQPDRPRGRGQKTSDAPVKARAVAAGLPVLQPPRLGDPEFVDNLSDLRADLGVVAAFGRILSEALLATPRLGMVNVHASLLPKYRGASPVHRAVIAGERETGVTIMRVVKALDAGPTIASATRRIGPEETSEEVERDLARLGADLLVATLEAIADGTAIETPQVEVEASYAPRLVKEDGLVHWSQPAVQIHDLVRGLYPWPHAYTFLNGERFIILESIALDETTNARPGTVLRAEGETIDVAAEPGALRIVVIQPEGKRAMAAREFLAGHHLAAGGVFTTTS